MSRITLMTAERDSANAPYLKEMSALRRILRAWKDKLNKSSDTFVKIHELFAQYGKAALPTHPTELPNLTTKVVSSTHDL